MMIKFGDRQVLPEWNIFSLSCIDTKVQFCDILFISDKKYPGLLLV